MPFSPSTVNVTNIGGKGRKLKRTVPEEALDFDITTALAAPVNAHIADPAAAHAATAISVADAVNNFEGDDVEDVLKWVGYGLEGSRQNGVIFGFTFTAVGLTITMASPSAALFKASAKDFSAATLTLSDNVTQWIYIDGSTGALSKSTGGTPPTLRDGNILLWRVTTSGGALVTPYQDYRYFVTHTDRKVSLSIATANETEDTQSEGNFSTIEAAFNYITSYANQNTKYLVRVRGLHTITGTMSIPANSVIIEGEGGTAGFTTNASTAVNPMFNINGKSGTTFRNISFLSAVAGCTAIGDSTGSSSGVGIYQCSFRHAGTNIYWQYAINLTSTSASDDLIIQNCYVETYGTGISITRPNRTRILNCTISSPSGVGRYGISLGVAATAAVSTQGDSTIRDCLFQGFKDSGGTPDGWAIYAKAYRTKILNCSAAECNNGIDVTSAQDTLIDGCMITLDSSVGVLGIRVSSNPHVKVANTHLTLNRTVWVAQQPAGVTSASNYLTVTGCYISGFANTSTTIGTGVLLTAGNNATIAGTTIEACINGVYANRATSAVTGLTITGCQLVNLSEYITCEGASQVSITGNSLRCDNNTNSEGIYLLSCRHFGVSTNTIEGDSGEMGVGIRIVGDNSPTSDMCLNGTVSSNTLTGVDLGIQVTGYVYRVAITGNVLDGMSVGNGAGILVESSTTVGSTGNPKNITIHGNTISRHYNGIVLDGDETGQIQECTITSNTVSYCANDTTGGVFTGCFGVGAQYCNLLNVSGNMISNIGRYISDSGSVTQPAGARVDAYGIFVRNSINVTVDTNEVFTTTLKGAGTGHGIAYDLSSNNVGLTARSLRIVGNKVSSNTSHGIQLSLDDGSVATSNTLTGVIIEGNLLRGNLSAVYVSVGTSVTCTELSIVGNWCYDNTQSAIYLNCDGAATDFKGIRINRNTIQAATATSTQSGILVVARKTLENLAVQSNVISNMDLYGIWIDQQTAGADFERLLIESNQVTTCTNDAICVECDGQIRELTVVNNTCAQSGTGFRIAQNEDGTGADICSTILFQGNTFRGNTGANCYLQFTGNVSGLYMSNCLFVGSTGDEGLRLQFSGTSDQAIRSAVITECNFSGNADYGLRFVVTAGAGEAQDIRISDCNFASNATANDFDAALIEIHPDVSGLSLTNCTFRGNCVPGTAKADLQLLLGDNGSDATDVILQNLVFKDSKGLGAYYNSSNVSGTATCNNLAVIDCSFDTPIRAGLLLELSGYTGANQVRVVGNRCYNGSSNGLELVGPGGATSGLTVQGNQCQGNDLIGIDLEFTGGLTGYNITNNTCALNSSIGLSLDINTGTSTDDCFAGVIANNVMRLNAASGMLLTTRLDVRNISIANNLFHDNNLYGFYWELGTSGSPVGVLTEGTVVGASITGNISLNNTSGDARMAGTNATNIKGILLGNQNSVASGASSWDGFSIDTPATYEAVNRNSVA